MQGDGAERNLSGLVLQFHSKTDNFVIQHQIKFMKRIMYIQPECDVESNYGFLELICQSPVDGGLEGTKDEDWVI